MNAKGCCHIPGELSYWITFLTRLLPLRSQYTFVELLIGAMLTQTGFITDAYLMLDMQNHWNSYYKWLQQGKWSWLNLAKGFLALSLAVLKEPVWHFAIDDYVTLRASKKAPGSQIHHQHGNKPNLAKYVRGQCWVSLALVTSQSIRSMAIPILNRLIPSASNTGKLVAGNTMIRAIAPILKGKTVRILVDSWYMRRVFIESMLSHGFNVIGQARIDTRLYDQPKPLKKAKRGRPRKYGEQYTRKRTAHLKKVEATLKVYGKEQRLRYRTKLVKARFLDGLLVRAVWCEFYDTKKDQWLSTRLLISTDTQMTAEQVIESYGLRWSIESMFHQLKNAWGLKEAWQQSRQTLHRWVHINMIGYGLVQLLSLSNSTQVDVLSALSPWRTKNTRTAGELRKGLTIIFRHVNVRRLWNKKRQKFGRYCDDEFDDIEIYTAKAA